MSSTQAPTDHERLSNGENTQAEARRGFFTYQSPLTRFPLLHSHSQRPFSGYAWQRSDTATTSDSTFGFYISNTFIDLRPLKVAATVKWFSDPSIRICQYEVPGGGECRDSNCSDLHLSQMSNTEPDDEETAQYLSSAVPQCAEMDAGKIRKALEETRQRRTANGNLEHRIAEALASLGVR
ncbi:hypothetical protein BXZ70DRAFT_922389 [Cristinia sonorae]|uniref:Zinc-finger domain-containing protein n=1 Tax=Cristinia sonorae TaxID=1940300 RepID=A0A8K0XSY0_9AGAR|nr:hypothetical protein BXZ70DRAFT_922389 [Cristinia sonorae]